MILRTAKPTKILYHLVIILARMTTVNETVIMSNRDIKLEEITVTGQSVSPSKPITHTAMVAPHPKGIRT